MRFVEEEAWQFPWGGETEIPRECREEKDEILESA